MPIELPSSEVLADFQQFVARVHRVDEDAAIRLSVHDTMIAVSAAPLYPVGLGDTMPLALALRVLPLVGSTDGNVDAVVPAIALKDRFARASRTDSLSIDIPPQRMSRSWTGIAPPRSGWALKREVSTDALAHVAETCIREVSAGAPAGSGAHAVSALRRAVWSRPMAQVADIELDLPAGVAFGLEACGFLVGGKARVFVAPGWGRVSTAYGHVLTRLLPS